MEVSRHAFKTEELWLKAVLSKSTKTTTKAADTGVDIHDALEKVFKDALPIKHAVLAYATRTKINDYFGSGIQWDVEKYFAHPLGFGGRCDLSSQDGAGIVVDYKTKEDFKRNEKGVIPKLAYDNHVQQLRSYADGLGIPNARLVNIFIEYSGEVVFHEWERADGDRAWDMFKLVLELWKLDKKYDSSYEIKESTNE